MALQIVYVSTTASGQRGLFTNGVLAWPFRENKYHSVKTNMPWDNLTQEQKICFCLSIGFELDLENQ